MSIEEIIQHYDLRQARESSLTRPETIPTNLLHLFSDRESVDAYKNDAGAAWLLTSASEGRFILEGSLPPREQSSQSCKAMNRPTSADRPTSEPRPKSTPRSRRA